MAEVSALVHSLAVTCRRALDSLERIIPSLESTVRAGGTPRVSAIAGNLEISLP